MKPRILAFLLLATVLVGGGTSRAGTGQRTGTIAFLRMPAGSASRGWQAALFVVAGRGGAPRRLTPRGTSVWSYRWSPDGTEIAYLDQGFSLRLVRPDGTGARLLLPASQLKALGLTWSPNGRNLAIVSPGPDANAHRAGCSKLALYVVPVDGGEPVLVSPSRRGIGCGVAWSPRGGEIAYGDGGGGLGVISTQGGRPRVLLTSGVGAPQWSPEGTKLAAPTVIHLGRRTLRYRRITVVDADGSDPHVVTDHAYTEYPFAWSPDSRHVLYGREDRKGIYVIDSDGRGNHRVTRDSPPQAAWGALSWAPDGRSIVYATDRTGNGDLYVIGAEGRDRARLTSGPDSDLAPSWTGR